MFLPVFLFLASSLVAALPALSDKAEEAAFSYRRPIIPEYGPRDKPETLNKILVMAVDHGNFSVVKDLLDLPLSRGVDPSMNNNFLVSMAAGKGYWSILNLFIDQSLARRINLAVYYNYPLRRASEVGMLPIVRRLCELPIYHNIDPAASNNEPLQAAVRNNHVDVARYLLSLDPRRGVRPSNDMLRFAVSKNLPRMVRLFLELPFEYGLDHSIAFGFDFNPRSDSKGYI